MSDLVRRAEEGVSWLVTENGKTKAGRSRACPPGSCPPKPYCAAIIAEAWSFVHGVEPAPTNQKAATAAHLLWRESLEGLSMEETKLALEWMLTTDAKKSWGEPLNGWRRHFKQAKEPHVSEMRKEIRSHLTEGKRQAELSELVLDFAIEDIGFEPPEIDFRIQSLDAVDDADPAEGF